jgi:hypothetical protein
MVGMEGKMMKSLMEMKVERMDNSDMMGMNKESKNNLEEMEGLEDLENMVCMDKKMILKGLMVVKFVQI